MDFDDLYTKITSSKSSKSESGLGFNIFLMQTSKNAINITVNQSFLDLTRKSVFSIVFKNSLKFQIFDSFLEVNPS